jgi:hypothetical protein
MGSLIVWKLVIGVVLFCGGIYLLSQAYMSRNRLQDMSDTATWTASQLSGAMGQSKMGKLVEVKGKVICEEPVSSSESHTMCAMYRTVVKQKIREHYRSDGRNQTRTTWRKTNEFTDARDFYVEDATGRVKVFPANAELILQQSADVYEDKGDSVLGGMFDFSREDVLLAEQRTEEILPIGQKIYVLGELFQKEGEPIIVTPTDGSRFLISVKSEEQLTADDQQSLTLNFYLGIGLTIGGIILLLVTFLSKGSL